MHVDSIQTDANLKRLRKDAGPLFFSTMAKPTASMLDWMLCYLDSINIHVKFNKENDVMYMEQTDFFLLMDMLGIMEMKRHYCWQRAQGVTYYGDVDQYTIDSYDITPFRPRVAATGRATIEMVRMMHMVGVTDDNTYIDNYNNALCLTKQACRMMLYAAHSIIRNYLDGLEELVDETCL